MRVFALQCSSLDAPSPRVITFFLRSQVRRLVKVGEFLVFGLSLPVDIPYRPCGPTSLCALVLCFFSGRVFFVLFLEFPDFAHD